MIRVVRGPVADASADAFVRPVGADLESCSAASLAIEVAAGQGVAERLRSIGDLDVGGAIVTEAGDLDAEFLIHVVIRSRDEPVSEERVARAFRNGLLQAAAWGVRQLVVPPLGVGPGNLEPEHAARLMCRVAEAHLQEARLPSEILLVVDNEYDQDIFQREVSRRATNPSAPTA